MTLKSATEAVRGVAAALLCTAALAGVGHPAFAHGTSAAEASAASSEMSFYCVASEVGRTDATGTSNWRHYVSGIFTADTGAQQAIERAFGDFLARRYDADVDPNCIGNFDRSRTASARSSRMNNPSSAGGDHRVIDTGWSYSGGR